MFTIVHILDLLYREASSGKSKADPITSYRQLVCLSLLRSVALEISEVFVGIYNPRHAPRVTSL